VITLRRAAERFHTRTDWLDSRHSFSFGHHRDPRHMGFGPLRVLNDDRVAAGGGFGTHAHRDAEIVSWVLDGALQHRDSMGNGSVIRPGDLQRMSAGTGVSHSEWNHSATEPVRFLQIWFLPDRAGHAPSYQQLHVPVEARRARWAPLVSPDGRAGSARVHQDVVLYDSLLEPGEAVEHAPAPGRRLWLQVARGAADAAGHALVEGDGLACAGEGVLRVEARQAGTELLLFDLPGTP
jgi:quercetin 2,3-dioxygenase